MVLLLVPQGLKYLSCFMSISLCLFRLNSCWKVHPCRCQECCIHSTLLQAVFMKWGRGGGGGWNSVISWQHAIKGSCWQSHKSHKRSVTQGQSKGNRFGHWIMMNLSDKETLCVDMPVCNFALSIASIKAERH